jgi:hypothetical protein
VTITLQTPELDERSQKALSIYEERIKSLVEPEHRGRGIAILPETGDYEIGKNPFLAGRALRQRHPGAQVVTFKIGLEPDYALTARYLTGLLHQQQTGRE